MDSWTLYTLWAASCALGLAVALAGEYRSNTVLSGAGKLLAASSYIGAALALGALDSGYGLVLLLAMAFCWSGDLLLVSRNNRSLFLAGLVSFLLGHLAFIGAFTVRGISMPILAAVTVLMALFGWRVLRWLNPSLDGRMRHPVWLYVVAICAMMAMAIATYWARGGLVVLLGGLLFVASDLSVARNRFVAPGFVNRAWGLPLYFIAQLLFAASVDFP